MFNDNKVLCFDHTFVVTLTEEETNKVFTKLYKTYECTIEVSKKIAEDILEIKLDKCPTAADLGIDMTDEIFNQQIEELIEDFYIKQFYSGLIILAIDYGTLHEGWVKRVIFEQYAELLNINTDN